jgi:uncharacterized protein DUF6545
MAINVYWQWMRLRASIDTMTSMSHTGLINFAYGSLGTVLVSAAVISAARSGGASAPPARRAMYASLGTLGVSFLVQSPAARTVQDALLVNLGQLLGNGTTLVAAFAARAMVLHLLFDETVAAARVRRRVLALLLVLAGMTAAFLATPMAPDRFTTPSPPGGIVLYYALFTGYLTLAVTDLMRLAWRNADRVHDPALRTGLRLLAGSAVASAAYLVARLGVLTAGWSGVAVSGGGDRFGTLEFLVATVLPGVGVTLTVAGIVLGAWGRWNRDRRSYRRLRPLWEAARDGCPEVVLPLPPGAGVRLRLYRRIIEIQDAQRTARMRLSAARQREIDEAVAGCGLEPEAAAAVTEAAMFAAGLRCQAPGDGAAGTPAAGTELDFPGVVSFLERVSAAYDNSPVVRRFAAED